MTELACFDERRQLSEGDLPAELVVGGERTAGVWALNRMAAAASLRFLSEFSSLTRLRRHVQPSPASAEERQELVGIQDFEPERLTLRIDVDKDHGRQFDRARNLTLIEAEIQGVHIFVEANVESSVHILLTYLQQPLPHRYDVVTQHAVLIDDRNDASR